MASKANFTVERIAGFKCQPGRQQTIYWDAKTAGLGLRVTAAGAKAYVFEGRLHGRTVRITIGDPSTWLIPKAQAEARRLGTLLDQNIDPRAEEAEKRAQAAAARADAAKAIVTIAQAWADYLEVVRSKRSHRYYLDHVRLSAAGGDVKKRGQGQTVAGPLASLMTKPLAELDSDTIAEWLDAEAQGRPTNAAHAYRLLRAFIRWTHDAEAYRGIVPQEAYKSRSISDALPESRAKPGDVLQREQLAGWFRAVRSLSNPIQSAYLQALLLTGARREEVAPLLWADVDFKWRSIRLRDKIEGERTIPMPPYLADLLLGLKRRNDTPPVVRLGERTEWEPSPYVFSSRSKSGRLVEPRAAHNRALAEAGLPHVSLHGLRRSFGTLSEWVEAPTGIVAQIMGHRPSAVAEKHYRRRPLDLLRAWHDKIEAWILDQAQVTFTGAAASQPLRVAQ